MISRRTARVIAEAYTGKFSSPNDVFRSSLYDFLFDHGYPAWLCNLINSLYSRRMLKEFVMKLHTGESQVPATLKWDWDRRRALGQSYLRQLAEDILNYFEDEIRQFYVKHHAKAKDEVIRSLELDGYLYRSRTVLVSEATVIEVEEEIGILEHLHKRLNLQNYEAAFAFLRLSEEHYRAAKWSDSIGNSRKFLESTMQEVAASHELQKSGSSLPDRTFNRPFAVRDYLESEGLLESIEKEAISKIYGLLSHTGSHPYMAEEDQARLLRQLALTVSQFVMLRLEGSLGEAATGNA